MTDDTPSLDAFAVDPAMHCPDFVPADRAGHLLDVLRAQWLAAAAALYDRLHALAPKLDTLRDPAEIEALIGAETAVAVADMQRAKDEFYQRIASAEH